MQRRAAEQAVLVCVAAQQLKWCVLLRLHVLRVVPTCCWVPRREALSRASADAERAAASAVVRRRGGSSLSKGKRTLARCVRNHAASPAQ